MISIFLGASSKSSWQGSFSLFLAFDNSFSKSSFIFSIFSISFCALFDFKKSSSNFSFKFGNEIFSFIVCISGVNQITVLNIFL